MQDPYWTSVATDEGITTRARYQPGETRSGWVEKTDAVDHAENAVVVGGPDRHLRTVADSELTTSTSPHPPRVSRAG